MPRITSCKPRYSREVMRLRNRWLSNRVCLQWELIKQTRFKFRFIEAA